jgi:cytochrome c biogenesis protein CcdA
MVRSTSRFVDILLAAGLGLSGLLFLLGEPKHRHKHAPVENATPAASYLLGLGSSFVVSPCCTPVIAAISSLAIPAGQPLLGIALILAFAVGHVLPIFGTTFFSTRVPRFVTRRAVPAASIIAGTLMLGLAAFYGVLA